MNIGEEIRREVIIAEPVRLPAPLETPPAPVERPKAPVPAPAPEPAAVPA